MINDYRFLPCDATAPSGPGTPLYRDFMITNAIGKSPLDDGSAHRRDLYMTTYHTHKRQTSMPSAWFEPAILATERPQTHAIDRAASGIGLMIATAGGNFNHRLRKWKIIIGQFKTFHFPYTELKFLIVLKHVSNRTAVNLLAPELFFFNFSTPCI